MGLRAAKSIIALVAGLAMVSLSSRLASAGPEELLADVNNAATAYLGAVATATLGAQSTYEMATTGSVVRRENGVTTMGSILTQEEAVLRIETARGATSQRTAGLSTPIQAHLSDPALEPIATFWLAFEKALNIRVEYMFEEWLELIEQAPSERDKSARQVLNRTLIDRALAYDILVHRELIREGLNRTFASKSTQGPGAYVLALQAKNHSLKSLGRLLHSGAQMKGAERTLRQEIGHWRSSLSELSRLMDRFEADLQAFPSDSANERRIKDRLEGTLSLYRAVIQAEHNLVDKVSSMKEQTEFGDQNAVRPAFFGSDWNDVLRLAKRRDDAIANLHSIPRP